MRMGFRFSALILWFFSFMLRGGFGWGEGFCLIFGFLGFLFEFGLFIFVGVACLFLFHCLVLVWFSLLCFFQ